MLRCHEILEDAPRDTLTDADDYGSHTELASLGADVEATHEMLTALTGLIAPPAPQIVRAGTRELAAVDGAVDAAVETLAPVSELLQAQGSDT